MKIYFFTLVILVALSIPAFSQADTVRLRDIAKQSKIVTDRPPQAVYFQLGGSGPIASANYDRRFGKRVNGVGFSAGLGYWNEFGISIFSIPVSVNYLFGRKNHFLELAAGTTFVSADVDWFDSQDENASGFIHHVNMGYRHQPTQGGFFFRGGISPLFVFEEGGYATSAYLGFGYNF